MATPQNDPPGFASSVEPKDAADWGQNFDNGKARALNCVPRGDTNPEHPDADPAVQDRVAVVNRISGSDESRKPIRGKLGASQRPRAPITRVELNFRERLTFYLMLGVLHALSLIPDFVLYLLGGAGGLIGYVVDRRHVRIGLKNLAFAFPIKNEPERRRILRASYINLGLCAAEYIRLAGFFYYRLRRRVTYRRFEYWEEMKRRYPEKGVVILTAHFGNFELLPAAHALQGHPISLVHHTQRFLPGDALMTYVRERVGITIIRKHAAARAVLKSLREGALVGIPFDQNAKRSEAIFVPFFGEAAATSSGLARLVALSGVPVVPVFLVRESDGRSHRIEILDEVPLQKTGDDAADIEENTRRFTRAVEEIARRYPEQFLWTHRRYRTRPRGLPPVYDR
jgi:KDO2-lipid IV(A) lauroyltransferase